MGAGYGSGNRVCNIELPHIPGLDQSVLAAWCGCLLVHEATHGVIGSRGIVNDEETCSRIERLCMAEQNRFAAKLVKLDPDRYPARLLYFDYDEKYWRWEWRATPQQRRRAFLSHFRADTKDGPSAAPNGHTAAPPGTTGVKDGPPSVS